jgi:hypothetical protein
VITQSLGWPSEVVVELDDVVVVEYKVIVAELDDVVVSPTCEDPVVER